MLRRLYRFGLRALQGTSAALGLNVALTRDYYSPLPVLSELERNRERWDKPSQLRGVSFDLDAMKQRLAALCNDYAHELASLPSYEESKKLEYGPGFTFHDTQFLYCMLRDLEPRRFIEIGSGLSTFWASLALDRNRAEGSACQMIAIDPYARDRVRQISGLEVIARPVQEVEPEFFSVLGEGDVLFIDSTHVVKLDGDVPHLYLEIVPALGPGVVVHAHDIHFPYNVPYPVEKNVFGMKWPRLWTETMLLQAFLAYNSAFEIVLSPPLLRHFDEAFLRATVPDYRPVEKGDFDTHFGSIWFRRKPQREESDAKNLTRRS